MIVNAKNQHSNIDGENARARRPGTPVRGRSCWSERLAVLGRWAFSFSRPGSEPASVAVMPVESVKENGHDSKEAVQIGRRDDIPLAPLRGTAFTAGGRSAASTGRSRWDTCIRQHGHWGARSKPGNVQPDDPAFPNLAHKWRLTDRHAQPTTSQSCPVIRERTKGSVYSNPTHGIHKLGFPNHVPEVDVA
jgi:hypothetical protein